MQEFEQAVELAERQVVRNVLDRAEDALAEGRTVQLVREFQSSPGEVLREFTDLETFRRWERDVLANLDEDGP
jgi:hypothetical protein